MAREANAPIVPRVTDASLFGGTVAGRGGRKTAGCKCRVCGAKERIRTVAGQVMTNICHALDGICGSCLWKEVS